MKTILYFLLDRWADFEAAYISTAVAMLGEGKFENKTVSLSAAPVRSVGGFAAVPDYVLSDVPDDYDALILIGGMSWHGEEAAKVKPLVEKTLKSGRLLGAICDACRFLGTMGALNHCQHTANDFDELVRSAGAAYTNANGFVHRQAVCDGNVVTANGTASAEFAREVLRALLVADEKTIDCWYEFHKLGLYTAPLPGMR